MAITSVVAAKSFQLDTLKAYVITFKCATSGTYSISTGVKTAATGAPITQELPSPITYELPSFKEVYGVFQMASTACKCSIVTVSSTDPTLAAVEITLTSAANRAVSLLIVGR